MEDMKDLLGQQAQQDFQSLRQVMMLLSESGYMVQKGDHLALSPKGVRRIGQLALRDIYQGLLKDRAGIHTTDHRGITEMRPDRSDLTVRRSAQSEPGRDPQARARAPSGRAARAQARRFRDLRKRLRQLVVNRAVPGHVVVDELGGAVRRGQEGRDGAGDAHPFEVSARLLFDCRILYSRGRIETQGSARSVVEHGRSVHQSAGRPAAGDATCSDAIPRATSTSS